MCRLKELDLCHNSIGNDGAVQLAEAIRSSASLVVVDLRHNKIVDT
jgi:Ran GTPase-activating protein (RanGAP) involved in mRNA processing and transport